MEKTEFNFKECTLSKLDKLFDLEIMDDIPPMTTWLTDDMVISEVEKEILQLYQRNLKQYVHDWNETELRQHFIGPMFTLVDFSSKKIGLFSERHLKGVINGITLKGNPDGMITSGFREPGQPYFCTSYASQEYKRHRDPDGDPAGQCLAAMLVGQEMNQQTFPLYGCHVIGADWYFMLLKGQEYAISPAYVATKDDIYDIFRRLKLLKRIIMELVS
ncbi:hypothetical protein QUF64_03425 [Anaerolineales bacterium HSG6]|nr:hypothetical protein [Anaerolineales bacterium HSG6]